MHSLSQKLMLPLHCLLSPFLLLLFAPPWKAQPCWTSLLTPYRPCTWGCPTSAISSGPTAIHISFVNTVYTQAKDDTNCIKETCVSFCSTPHVSQRTPFPWGHAGSPQNRLISHWFSEAPAQDLMALETRLPTSGNSGHSGLRWDGDGDPQGPRSSHTDPAATREPPTTSSGTAQHGKMRG
jgi:hypothetical protein